MLVELAQVIVFGTLALLGLRGSPYWIAAGWALHPFWDVVLHYIGPGGTLIYSLDLRYRVYQFRLADCHLYRHRLRSGWEQQAAIPRCRYYLDEAPLVAQATVCNVDDTAGYVHRNSRKSGP
jgi:hypothetical protein